jgi:hypothetical protein
MTVYHIAGSMMIIIFPRSRSPVQASRQNVFIVFVKCTPKFSCVCNFPGAFQKIYQTHFKKVMSMTKQYVYIPSTDIYLLQKLDLYHPQRLKQQQARKYSCIKMQKANHLVPFINRPIQFV